MYLFEKEKPKFLHGYIMCLRERNDCPSYPCVVRLLEDGRMHDEGASKFYDMDHHPYFAWDYINRIPKPIKPYIPEFQPD